MVKDIDFKDVEADVDVIAALDEALSSPTAPEDCMQLSELDGFLTGLAVTPEIVAPEEWLPWVWGDGFEDEAESDAVEGLLLDHFDRIRSDLEDGYSIDPLFWENEDGTIDAGEWADGFMAAVDIRPKEWLPILEDDQGRLHMVPILALACDDEGVPLLRLTGQDLARIVDDVEAVIPKAVEEIRDYWNSQEGTALN